MKHFLSFTCLAFLLACNLPSISTGVPNPSPLPTMPKNDPDGLSTPEGQACASMRKAGCTDGYPADNGATCFRTMMGIKAEGIPIPTACLVAAKSILEVKACGDSSTLTIRCF